MISSFVRAKHVEISEEIRREGTAEIRTSVQED